MDENKLEQMICDELTKHLDKCYNDKLLRDLYVNDIMKLVRDLRNFSWGRGCKFGEEHACD